VKKVINCLKEDNPVINKKLRKVSLDEGNKIAAELFQILSKRKDGIGLAANQVGIDASVAVVNVRKPIILINPEVVEQWDETPYYEGCLSYKGKGIHTKRYKNIIVKTEQEDGEWYFSGTENPSDGKGSWEESSDKKQDQELRLLEAICVQHEIDHLNGMTIHNRQVVTTIVNKEKYGRNEIVMITDGNETKELKWKKAKSLVEAGDWEIYVGGPIT
jgi:peptide deformylase|tara:strand:- start:1863 stop:2513 length:651 start_codon:yes stop_codon:yes gene_type:complete